MNFKQIILALFTLEFVAITLYALAHGGSVANVWDWVCANPWGFQVALDLMVAVIFGMVWIWRDAKVKGINPYPHLALCLCLGSLGLLTYTLRRGRSETMLPKAAATQLA